MRKKKKIMPRRQLNRRPLDLWSDALSAGPTRNPIAPGTHWGGPMKSRIVYEFLLLEWFQTGR